MLSVVAPTPNLDRRSGGNPDLDWATLGPRYRDELLATLERARLDRASPTRSRWSTWTPR